LAFEKFRQKIVGLQSDLQLFETQFLDVDGFKEFADNLRRYLLEYNEICITGYFSETVREDLESIVRIQRKVRIICPEFPKKMSKRDEKNLLALYDLAEAGAEIKVNNRLHARFLVAYHPDKEIRWGLLIIGSFDFNADCLAKERYDAGIKTKNPDLINSARDLFNQIWNKRGSKLLSEKYREKLEQLT